MRGVYLLVVAALLCLGAGVVSAQVAGGSYVNAKVYLDENEVNNTIDFGFIPPLPKGAIGDRVWEDRDKDGIQDDGEPGILGVMVRLLDSSGNELKNTTTIDKNGTYWFEELFAGNYTVSVDIPAGYEPTLSYQGSPENDSNGEVPP